jgi:hypothetical protein
MNRNALAVAVGAGLAAAPLVSAQAFEYAISGHINRTIVQLDNGDDSSVFHADNDSSSSRLRATGSGDFGSGKAGFTWEHQFESNSTAGLDLPNVSAGADSDSMRKAEVWMSYDWGKITIGQGSDAIDGITEVDLGGGAWAGGVYAYPVDMMAGVNWVDNNGVRLVSSGFTVSSAITSFDGGRRDRVRYDSPALGPLSFAVSLANGDRLDASVRGSHEFGQVQFSWGLGISDSGDAGGTKTVTTATGTKLEADDEDPSVTVGSAALKVGGFDFLVAFGELDRDICNVGAGCTGIVTGPGGNTSDPEHTYLAVGYTTPGGHHFRFGTGETTDLAGDDIDGEVTQIGWGYAPNKSVDVYASWTEAELDVPSVLLSPGVSVEDVTALQFGVRVKFK